MTADDLADEAMAALQTVPLVERSYVLGVLTWTEPEAVLAAIDTWRNDPDARNRCSDNTPRQATG